MRDVNPKMINFARGATAVEQHQTSAYLGAAQHRKSATDHEYEFAAMQLRVPFDGILGMPWLRTANPSINRVTRTATLPGGAEPIVER